MFIESKSISENVYVVKGEGMPFIIYAPLSGHILQCDAGDVERLRDAFAHQTSAAPEIRDLITCINSNDLSITPSITHPRDYRKLSILSNYKCNLNCVYCYSAKGRSSEEISPLQMKAAIKYLLDGTPTGRSCSLFFSGGGEPLISWKIISPVLSQAIHEAREKDIDMNIHFMSNGTIYSKEISDFLRENNISLCVSFEILDNLQDRIRGHYKQVSDNLLKYLNDGNIVYISSTITPDSVSHLPEMIQAVASRFNGVSTVTMEPVTGTELFDSPEKMSAFYDEFDRKFHEALKIAQKYGIELNTSTKNITDNFVERYCPGKLCLTPKGTFTICHCASSPKEERYDKCSYGQIDPLGNIKFDLDKFKALIAVNHNIYNECNDCFAKIHCGGECMTRRDTYSPEFMKVVCNRTRRLVFQELLTILNEN